MHHPSCPCFRAQVVVVAGLQLSARTRCVRHKLSSATEHTNTSYPEHTLGGTRAAAHRPVCTPIRDQQRHRCLCRRSWPLSKLPMTRASAGAARAMGLPFSHTARSCHEPTSQPADPPNFGHASAVSVPHARECAAHPRPPPRARTLKSHVLTAPELSQADRQVALTFPPRPPVRRGVPQCCPARRLSLYLLYG